MGSCVGVSIKHQTAGSVQGQHIAACLFTSVSSFLSVCLSRRHVIFLLTPSSHPLSLSLILSHLSLSVTTPCAPPFDFFARHARSSRAIFQSLYYTPALCLEINTHNMMSALSTDTLTGKFYQANTRKQTYHRMATTDLSLGQ